MANVDQPFGLLPCGHLLGLNWTARSRMYYIASNNGSAFAIGDPVVLSGSADANGVPGIALASAGTGNEVLGAFMGAGIVEAGPYADPTNLNTTVVPASKSKAYYALVSDDPYIIYEIQESDDGTALTVADVGARGNLVSGTNNGYVSGWELSESGVTTTNTLQLTLMGLVRRPGNAFGNYAKWLVMINNHCYKAGTTGL